MDVIKILRGWRPGSYDTNANGEPWNWLDEAYDIATRECACCGESGHYQSLLVLRMRTAGVFWDLDENPVVLGDDGRVWEGHHRIWAAFTLGWENLPVVMGGTRGES